MGQTLLVADGGGHLTQLALLEDRLDPRPREPVWVTHDTPQASELAKHATVVHAHQPTTRHVPNAARNLQLARRVLDEHNINRMVTTGAALAVPFALIAWRRGIPVHFIESATRFRGPSLSARLTERLPNVVCYAQHPTWLRSGWHHRGSVLDRYEVETCSSPATVRTIFVSLGTHAYPFPALVERLREAIPAEVDIVWQLASTPAPTGLHGRVHAFLGAKEQSHALETADVVVGHAGTGLLLSALEAGKVPVLVPRRPDHAEHVDDHQVRISQEFARQGLAVVRAVDRLDWSALLEASRHRAVRARVAAAFRLVEDGVR